MSALASTCISSQTRPRSKRTRAASRFQVKRRSRPSMLKVPSPLLGMPSSMAPRSPAAVMVVCMTTREGVGSAMASPGVAGGRAG